PRSSSVIDVGTSSATFIMEDSSAATGDSGVISDDG
ncbi:hypothetical protein A2U01_0078949, partial [Trifolium medium]|nr:hypothetical protein [Trifolium medium]